MDDPIVSTAHAEAFDYPEEDAYQDEPTLAGKTPTFPSLERAAKQLHVVPATPNCCQSCRAYFASLAAVSSYGAHTYIGGPVRQPRQSVCPNCGLAGSLPCGCTEG